MLLKLKVIELTFILYSRIMLFKCCEEDVQDVVGGSNAGWKHELPHHSLTVAPGSLCVTFFFRVNTEKLPIASRNSFNCGYNTNLIVLVH